MIPNNLDSGLTNILRDETLRNDYTRDRYSRLERELSKTKTPGMLKKFIKYLKKKKNKNERT